MVDSALPSLFLSMDASLQAIFNIPVSGVCCCTEERLGRHPARGYAS